VLLQNTCAGFLELFVLLQNTFAGSLKHARNGVIVMLAEVAHPGVHN